MTVKLQCNGRLVQETTYADSWLINTAHLQDYTGLISRLETIFVKASVSSNLRGSRLLSYHGRDLKHFSLIFIL